jgi:hypothetical protein
MNEHLQACLDWEVQHGYRAAPGTTLQESVNGSDIPLPHGGSYRLVGGKIVVNRTAAQERVLSEEAEAVTLHEQQHYDNDSPHSRLMRAVSKGGSSSPAPRAREEKQVAQVRAVKASDHTILCEALTGARPTYPASQTGAREIGTTAHHLRLLGPRF